MVNPAVNDALPDVLHATDASLQPDAPAPNASKRYAYGLVAAVALLLILALASLVVAWRAQERVKNIEQELVRRQQESQGQAVEARMLAKQAQDTSRESAAKVALLEARVAEVAVQRGQLEDLIQSMSRSRDENLVVDVEAGIRVAQQQSTITGSAEPLLAVLKQADERLARVNQPRLEGVRRAIARDLDKVRAVGVADINSLVIKLDEAVRLVDELPLLSGAESRSAESRGNATAAAPLKTAASAVPSPATATDWAKTWRDGWAAATNRVWLEAKSLIRVTRIDQPEAMLLAPEQAFFLRENVKLRLLNARLALLSRQFDTAQTDLQSAQTSLDRYFDRTARRTGLASDLVKQVAAQARQVTLPRPDDTLAALATASAGR
jgi:uroporphyrin-III C-methyltransferase